MPAMHPGGLPTGERTVAAAPWPWGAHASESASLPFVMRVGSVDPDRALTAPPWLGERPTVLVVEDDDDVASMLDDLLSDAGYRVYLAGDGQSGLAQAVRERPSVVLSDFMMPGMDGGQLVSKLHTNPRTRAIPVVLMSSSQHRVPGVPFVQKPFNVDDVLTLLARVRGDAAPLTRYGEG